MEAVKKLDPKPRIVGVRFLRPVVLRGKSFDFVENKGEFELAVKLDCQIVAVSRIDNAGVVRTAWVPFTAVAYIEWETPRS